MNSIEEDFIIQYDLKFADWSVFEQLRYQTSEIGRVSFPMIETQKLGYYYTYELRHFMGFGLSVKLSKL